MKLLYSLRLKDCEQIFKEGFEPGVLVTQEVYFRTVRDEDLASAMFAKAVLEEQDNFINRFIEVDIKEIDDEQEDGIQQQRD